MQFNALYENVFLDREKINTIDNWTSGEQTLRSTIFDWDKDNWEISGDISHQIDENNQLKLLFISNHSTGYDQILKYSSSDNRHSKLPRRFSTKENVLRANWKHQQGDRHSFDSGLEIAVNNLDDNLQDIRQSLPAYHSTEINDIKETRYEAFMHYNFTISTNLNLQSTLIYERSTMDVETNLSIISNGDISTSVKDGSSRTFSYLKPRLNIRYDLNDTYQMRFNVERTVSQLYLNDFVPSYNSFEFRLDETNPLLKPEVRDEFLLSIEKQWPKSNGSLTLTSYYHKISDLRTEVLLASLSGDGNIKHGKEKGIKFDSHFDLQAIGLDNTFINASYTWRDSQMIHPFSGQKSAIERMSKNQWNVKLSQNELLPGLSFSVVLAKKSPYQFYYFNYQGRVTLEKTANVFIDYQINQQLKVRLSGDDLLNRRYDVYKRRHSGLFTQNDVLRQEARRNERAPRLSLTLSGQF